MQSMRLTFFAAALTVLTGCAGNEMAGPAIGEMGRIGGEGIAVEIQNETPSSVRVFALAHGGEISLGRVSALGTRTVRLPYTLGQFRLAVRPSTEASPGQQHVSEPIEVVRGQRLTWELRASPSALLPQLSTVRVFSCRSQTEC